MLSDLFERQPFIPLPAPSSGGSGGEGESSQLPGDGSTLGLLSRQVQWVGRQQLSVLLLQTTLPDQVLTASALVSATARGLLPAVACLGA